MERCYGGGGVLVRSCRRGLVGKRAGAVGRCCGAVGRCCEEVFWGGPLELWGALWGCRGMSGVYICLVDLGRCYGEVL